MFDQLYKFFFRQTKLKYTYYMCIIVLTLVYATVSSVVLQNSLARTTGETILFVSSLFFGLILAVTYAWYSQQALEGGRFASALRVKRAIDVIFSALLLVLMAPMMILLVFLIKLTSHGPAFYREVRCGLNGRRFIQYKFRTMRKDAEKQLRVILHLNEMGGPVFKMWDDPRVTQIGRFLRKSSMDQLPLIWNVLKGDISLVGPRAPLPRELEESICWHQRRLSVKPGITCLWQVAGGYHMDFREWAKLDLQYVDNWSLSLDVKILLKTVVTVCFVKYNDTFVEENPSPQLGPPIRERQLA